MNADDLVYFVFAGAHRPLRMVGGDKPPADKVWVVRSIPGNVAAHGPSFNIASRKLRKLLDARMATAPSAKAWWAAEESKMTPTDRALFTNSFHRDKLPKMERGNGFVYFSSDSSAACLNG